MMNTAQKICRQATDATDAIRMAEVAGGEATQDWVNESTGYKFPDNSRMVVSWPVYFAWSDENV